MNNTIKVDSWAWGAEKIVWGYDPSHQYTFKILEPKRGKDGCLSLQYHHHKSESWLMIRGLAWALVVCGDNVCTRVLRPGDIQNLPTGVIHRLMGISDDVQVAEVSTPDKHAADKNAPKDVVRLHCVLGREVSKPRNQQESGVVSEAIRVTEAAILAVSKGELPVEQHSEQIVGGLSLWSPIA